MTSFNQSRSEVPVDFKGDFVKIKNFLVTVKEKGSVNDYHIRLVLQTKGYIKPVWKRVPYVDNPKKMNNVFDRWVLTSKGERFLKGLEGLKG